MSVLLVFGSVVLFYGIITCSGTMQFEEGSSFNKQHGNFSPFYRVAQ